MILQTYLTELRDVMASQGELNSTVHRKFDLCTYMAPMYKLLCTGLNTSIYRLPFPMIPPGYVPIGVDAAKYSLAELRSDYRRGLVVAVSFCVFVMPVLLGTRYDHYITYVIYTRNSLFLPSLL